MQAVIGRMLEMTQRHHHHSMSVLSIPQPV
jgi:hypothetical protein